MIDGLLPLAHLFETTCLNHCATLTFPPLLKPPSRCTCLIIISKLFFTTGPLPSSNAECVSVSVVSVIVKCPMLPPCVVGGRSRNPLYYYYYYYFFCSPVLRPVSVEEADTLGWDSEQARLASTVAVTGQWPQHLLFADRFGSPVIFVWLLWTGITVGLHQSCMSSKEISPWCDCNGWLGIKHQVTYCKQITGGGSNAEVDPSLQLCVGVSAFSPGMTFFFFFF